MGIGGFIDTNSDILIAVSLAVALVSLVLVIVLLRGLVRLKRPFRMMADIYEGGGAEKSLEELLKGVDENREFIRRLAGDVKMILKRLDGCHSGVGLVKYNAFEDVGGMQSYSLCILNNEKTGFILTNLVGRNATRGYALDITTGKPSRELSDEEKESFNYALRSLGA